MLVAEDDDVTRMRLEHLLTKWGHRVTSVSRGDVALEILSPSGPPHLAIVDWMMPGLDGVDLCRALRARKSDTYTYVILITARDDPDSMLVGLEAGADDFLAKPVAPEELRARLRAGHRIVELQERLIAAREEQRRHADRDGLTGVSSRRRVLEALDSSLSERAAGGTELALAMIDLDDFKPINDGHGHLVGDRVLRTVCERVQRILRRTDVFGRYGGDEFLVVLPETSQREALEIGAAHVRDARLPADRVRGPLAARHRERRHRHRRGRAVQPRRPDQARRPRAVPRQGRGRQPRDLRRIASRWSASTAHQARLLEDLLDARAQRRRAERLRQARGGARSEQLRALGRARLRRDHEHRQVARGGIGAQRLEHGRAVAARHHPVEDQEVGRGLAREHERLVAVAGLDHAIARERLLHEQAQEVFVVRHQDRLHHGRLAPVSMGWRRRLRAKIAGAMADPRSALCERRVAARHARGRAGHAHLPGPRRPQLQPLRDRADDPRAAVHRLAVALFCTWALALAYCARRLRASIATSAAPLANSAANPGSGR